MQLLYKSTYFCTSVLALALISSLFVFKYSRSLLYKASLRIKQDDLQSGSGDGGGNGGGGGGSFTWKPVWLYGFRKGALKKGVASPQWSFTTGSTVELNLPTTSKT